MDVHVLFSYNNTCGSNTYTEHKFQDFKTDIHGSINLGDHKWHNSRADKKDWQLLKST